jgi:uncharacterized protein
MEAELARIFIVSVSLFSAALLGFSAHRASLCSVKAVAEILTTHHAHMLVSFVKAMLWVVAIALPLSWAMSEQKIHVDAWALGLPALLGGAMFGAGATINGGCAFYTLSRLSSGQFAYLFTLIGFMMGCALQIRYFNGFVSHPAVPLLVLFDRPRIGSLLLLVVIWGLLLWELIRLWCTAPAGNWRNRIFASRYRLSSAAILLGVTNALLLVLWGNWSYTTTLHQGVLTYTQLGMEPMRIQLGLFAAILTGMVFSAWESGGMSFSVGKISDWVTRLFGGILMGMGAAILPGGNDELLLSAMPMLSPHAFPAFAAMLTTIAVMLMISKRVGGPNVSVNCQGDILRPR